MFWTRLNKLADSGSTILYIKYATIERPFPVTNVTNPMAGLQSLEHFDLVSVEKKFFFGFKFLKQARNNDTVCSQFVCNLLVAQINEGRASDPGLFF